MSRVRVINRAYTALDAATPGGIGAALAADPVLRNATRFALKCGEHTWGKDVKSNLFDNSDWKNADFERARSSPNRSLAGQYGTLESSWWEQRHWCVTTFMETLLAAKHPFADGIIAEFEELQPSPPSDLSGYQPGKADEVFQCGSMQIGFDSAGAIGHLKLGNGVVWASAARPLMQLKYRSYSMADVQDFLKGYCGTKWNSSWLQHDYGKPGLPADVEGKFWSPSLQELHVKRSIGAKWQSPQSGKGAGTECSFLLRTSFEAVPSEDYGAAAGWTAVEVDPVAQRINISIDMYNKSTTRLPEAMFVQLLPAPANVSWEVNKLGTWVGANDVVSGGSKHLHGITEPSAVRMVSGNDQLVVGATDAAVVNFGEMTAYPSPVDKNVSTEDDGASFLLWDNLWGTNYVMWWPFNPAPPPYSASGRFFPASSNHDMVSRYSIVATSTGA